MTVAEGNPILSWSGAIGGAGNPITAYEIEYSESTDNTTWGGWNALLVVNSSQPSGTVAVTISSVRGNYRRYQIRTRGSAGDSYYSDRKISSNTVRKNILAIPPSIFSASPAVYIGSTITLEWSGTIVGTSTIKNYVIQQSTSTNNSSWGAWEAVTTVVTSSTLGNQQVPANPVSGIFTRYRIAVTDSLDAISAYVISNSVRKNTLPPAPTVITLKNGSKTYNQQPRFLIQTGIELDGEPQTVWVYGTSQSWMNSVDNPNNFSQSGQIGNNQKTIFRNDTAPIGAYNISIKVKDENSESVVVTRAFTLLSSPFEEIIPNATHVKATHILTMRTAINNIRNYYGMTAYVWSGEIIAGTTQVRDWVYHIMEIRTAIEGVVDLINSFSENSTFNIPPIEWLPLGTGRPRADVMNQIISLILTI